MERYIYTTHDGSYVTLRYPAIELHKKMQKRLAEWEHHQAIAAVVTVNGCKWSPTLDVNQHTSTTAMLTMQSCVAKKPKVAESWVSGKHRYFRDADSSNILYNPSQV